MRQAIDSISRILVVRVECGGRKKVGMATEDVEEKNGGGLDGEGYAERGEEEKGRTRRGRSCVARGAGAGIGASGSSWQFLARWKA